MTTVTVLPPTSSLVQPSDQQLQQLEALVYRLRPDLDFRDDRDFRNLDHAREFRLAFKTIGMMGRLAAPDEGKSHSYWSSFARNLLQECGVTAEMPGNIVLVAVLAHGDIPHSTRALGLTWPGSGIAAGDAWKTVLASSQLRTKSPDPEHNYSCSPTGSNGIVNLDIGPNTFGYIGSYYR